MENYSNIDDNSFASYGYGGALVGATLISKVNDFLKGATYSVGGEKALAMGGWGNVYSTLPASELDNVIRYGKTYQGVLPNIGLKSIDGFKHVGNDELLTRASKGGKSLMMGGLDIMRPINAIIPAGITAYWGMDAYQEGGFAGLGNYLIQDFLANKAGMDQSVRTMQIMGPAKLKAGLHLGVSANTLINEGIQSVNIHGAALGSPMLSRLLNVGGAYQGAALGMDIGRSTAEAAAGFLRHELGGAGDHLINPSFVGFAGSIFGAGIGAKMGAAAFGSIGKSLLTLGGIIGYKVLESYMTKSLGGGGAGIKHKGLNFASNIAEYQTQAAVTMRQRSLQAMHKSHVNARSAFGQEASVLHMNRDMFSQYKR